MEKKKNLLDDGRINITISPSGLLGIKGRKPAPDSTFTISPPQAGERPEKQLSFLSSLSSLISSTSYMNKKKAADKESYMPVAPPRSQPPPVTPKLNILMQIIGSRGDVQPFLSLALVLAKPPYNHRVRIATHQCFEEFVHEVAASHGLAPGNLGSSSSASGGSVEFYPLAGDPAVLMSYMVRNPGLIPSTAALTGGEIRERRIGVWEILRSTWESCHQPYITPRNPTPVPFVADLIVANPPGFGHIHCAERLGVPVHIMFTMPWAPPTSAFPHPLANLPEGRQKRAVDEATINYLTYTLLDILTWQGTGDLINRFRTDILRLDPLNNVYAPTLIGNLAAGGLIPHTYCWSPALIPKPKDWDQQTICVSGFWFLDLNSGFVPPPEVVEFIEKSGDKPLIYIGFGSIVAPNPAFLTTAVLDAVKAAGTRALVSRGWGTIDPPEGFSDPDILFVGNIPHDWLFPRVSLAVHHGGAGTTAAAIKAGIPSAIVPFFGDQQFWGEMVMRRGAGGVLRSKELTGQKLASLIQSLLEPGVQEMARELGEIVNKEKGELVAAEGLLRGVEGILKGCEIEERMGWKGPLAAFTVIPQHPLVDGKKRKTKNKSGIRISARTAYLLHKGNLIDVDNPKEVKLTRWIEWDSWVSQNTERGPATGGASAILGTILAMGIAGGVDFDRETWFGKAKGTTTTADDSTGKGKETEVPGSGDSVASAASPPPPITASHIDMLLAAQAAAKPIGNIITAGLKSPIDFTLSVSRGFHNLPSTLFNDSTVRPLPPVHSSVKGIGSGANLATKHLAHGFYDGITGLVTQPLKGLRDGGVPGLIHGIASGLGGVVAKPAAGAFGVPAYLGAGLVKEVERLTGKEGKRRLWEVSVRVGRLKEGEREAQLWGELERVEISRIWKEMAHNYLRADLEGRRGNSTSDCSKRPTLAASASASSSKSFLGKLTKCNRKKEKEKGKETHCGSVASPPYDGIAELPDTVGSKPPLPRPLVAELPAPDNPLVAELPVTDNPRCVPRNETYDEEKALRQALQESLTQSVHKHVGGQTYLDGSSLGIQATEGQNDGDSDPELRAAILASLKGTLGGGESCDVEIHTPETEDENSDDEEDRMLSKVLEASRLAAEEEELERENERRMVERVLKMSLGEGEEKGKVV